MIELFDAYAGFGGYKPHRRAPVTRDDCLAQMRRVQIGRALVRTAPDDLDSDVAASNETLLSACEADEALTACPVVLPCGGPDPSADAANVDALIARGAGAVCIRPQADDWSLAAWASGGLFEALAARRVPVFCRADHVSLEAVADLAGRHPALPLIVAEVGYRSHRIVGPLLEAFAAVTLSLGGAFSLHRAVEDLARRVGPERIVFGTGYPAAEPTAAVTQLMYEDLADEQRTLIGSANLERLVGGIDR